MSDCKNCPYTDEYCASGDCERDNNLTEKWKKGELPKGEEYWVILTDEWYLQNPVKPVRAFYSCDCEFEGYLDDDIQQVFAPVPSYEKWQLMQADNKRLKHDVGNLGYKIKNQRKEIERQIAQNAQLKDLLKECRDIMNKAGFIFTKIVDVEKAKDLIKKIDEVLK